MLFSWRTYFTLWFILKCILFITFPVELDQLTGIAAILRFPMDDIEDDEENEEN